MLVRWEKKLNIRGPLAQAERCLDQWLQEEGRSLSKRQKQRAAALMARYFLHEDSVTDLIMLSFLRHYSGKQEIDMEDPTSVRMEIKAVLDQSRAAEPAEKRGISPYVIGALVAALFFSGWEISQKPITRTQQAELKALVHQIDALDPTVTTASLWAQMKEPLNVRRYQDIPWWRYRGSKKALEEKLAALTPRAGM